MHLIYLSLINTLLPNFSGLINQFVTGPWCEDAQIMLSGKKV